MALLYKLYQTKTNNNPMEYAAVKSNKPPAVSWDQGVGMSKHVLLDNVSHKDLRIITDRALEYGDNIPSVLTFPFEFRDVLTHYPICFSKDPETGKFHSIALFGFEDHENLFLGEHGWDASYVPLMIERQPFLIGFQQQEISSASPQRVLYVDMDSNRVSHMTGEALFLEHGGSTPYLQRMSSILEAVYKGQASSDIFFDTLLSHELIESFVLDIKLNDGSDNKLTGFYTINEEKLHSLSSEVKLKLMEDGILESVYMVVASLSNFRTLIERKNRSVKASI